MKAMRIQRKRTKGWRMPPDTVYVGRGSGMGNPFRVDLWNRTAKECVELYRRDLLRTLEVCPRFIDKLRGKHLACWCPLCEEHRDGKPLNVTCDKCSPCHVDVIGELLCGMEGGGE